nr:unnamed protein product [Callosobruchus analis]
MTFTSPPYGILTYCLS